MAKLKKIKRILIANRAEISLRVIKTCKEMGIETITIYKSEEKNYPHAFESDYSVCLGEGTLAQTYLNQDKIIEIAKEYKADAIHPGYGFLSENANFAKKVRENSIIFIGPSEKAITLMGDKKGSKELIEKIGVPAIPGYHGDDQSDETLYQEANKIGYPVLIKASAGGGGKGMRVVTDSNDFQSELESAKRESMNAFGDDRVLIEKYIQKPRHIEIQVFSDSHGSHLHLFERECSIQRRHQKIVEETLSTALDEKLRNEMGECAVKICKEIDYLGAGTVEFIFEDGKFYFLEMNTRLQVEHPVTEMITGVDLVKWQIMAAQGEPIELKQSDLSPRGHAIEVRIYAEDPDNNFMPQIGKIEKVGNTKLNSTRLDSGYIDLNEVTVNFDPMLAKLIAHGDTRQSAIQKILEELNSVCFLGIKTNINYLKRILSHPEFIKGNTYTDFVVINEESLKKNDNDNNLALAIAAKLLNPSKSKGNVVSNESTKAWDQINNFRI